MSVLPRRRGLRTAGRVRASTRHLFYETTRSICPKCREVIDARILIKNGKVFMRKQCVKHGWFGSLISSDAEIYRNAMRYDKLGTDINIDFEKINRSIGRVKSFVHEGKLGYTLIEAKKVS
ncbi:MAG: hypothetical protein ACE5OT_05685 [Candidatus Hadarchaeaceae archaeon]